MKLYPLKFVPKLIPKMWGGRQLEALLGKPISGDDPVGESWEVYDFPPGATGPDAIGPRDDPGGWISARINNGPLAGKTLHELVCGDDSREALLGECKPVETAHGPQFPLLIKFLDARQDLSVQVHPPPEYAASHPGAHVKNEAWHLIAVDPGARLMLGAKPGVTREHFSRALGRGREVEDLVHSVPVNRGETVYMPSGTVHALGGGIVAYEVQTPSDTTYRVYDFDRVDPSTGQGRKLHIQQALDCIQYQWDALKYRQPRHEGNAILARAPQWILMQVELRGTDVYRLDHSEGPIIATVLAGHGGFKQGEKQESFRVGETLLLPPHRETRILPREKTRLLLAATPPVDVDQLRPR